MKCSFFVQVRLDSCRSIWWVHLIGKIGLCKVVVVVGVVGLSFRCCYWWFVIRVNVRLGQIHMDQFGRCPPNLPN